MADRMSDEKFAETMRRLKSWIVEAQTLNRVHYIEKKNLLLEAEDILASLESTAYKVRVFNRPGIESEDEQLGAPLGSFWTDRY